MHLFVNIYPASILPKIWANCPSTRLKKYINRRGNKGLKKKKTMNAEMKLINMRHVMRPYVVVGWATNQLWATSEHANSTETHSDQERVPKSSCARTPRLIPWWPPYLTRQGHFSQLPPPAPVNKACCRVGEAWLSSLSFSQSTDQIYSEQQPLIICLRPNT